jgi:hypothetical protein
MFAHANIVTWILVIIGWIVVHYLTLTRDRRKEKRELAKITVANLINLEKEAVDFHCADQFDEHARESLLWKTGRINRLLSREPFNELKLNLVLMKKLRQCITLNNADRTGFSSQSVYSSLILDIRHTVDDLIYEIEKQTIKFWL